MLCIMFKDSHNHTGPGWAPDWNHCTKPNTHVHTGTLSQCYSSRVTIYKKDKRMDWAQIYKPYICNVLVQLFLPFLLRLQIFLLGIDCTLYFDICRFPLCQFCLKLGHDIARFLVKLTKRVRGSQNMLKHF